MSNKLTLLEIVQDILSDMVSDEINDIDDTVESQSVANIVKSTYLEMISNRNWPHTRKLVQLEALADVTKPNYLILPENLKELESFEYDTKKITDTRLYYTKIRYKDPDEFLRLCSGRDSTKTNITTVIDFSGVKLFINNDKAPEFYTSFDDKYLVCDGYDSAIDSTLQKSKTRSLAYLIPDWDRSNTAVPDLPMEAFPALIAASKSASFYNIKQMMNEKEEQKAVRQQRWLSRKAWRTNGGIKYADFGRKRCR